MNGRIRTIGAAILACAAFAAPALADLAIVNATVQSVGPRPGANGRRFMNIESIHNGNFASYGVARFDLTGDKAALDAQYGAGNWSATGATLVLTQQNAAFSAAGNVAIFFSSDDTTELSNALGSDGLPLSPLYFNNSIVPGGNTRDPNGGGIVREDDAVVSYTFGQTGSGNNGTVETYALTSSVALTARLQPGSASNIVTLVFEAQDDLVAATYAGYENSNSAGPTLTINAVSNSPSCPADFNGDTVLNADDIGDFITGYFNEPPDARCDFNADGAINADDLGDFITAYFNGC